MTKDYIEKLLKQPLLSNANDFRFLTSKLALPRPKSKARKKLRKIRPIVIESPVSKKLQNKWNLKPIKLKSKLSPSTEGKKILKICFHWLMQQVF